MTRFLPFLLSAFCFLLLCSCAVSPTINQVSIREKLIARAADDAFPPPTPEDWPPTTNLYWEAGAKVFTNDGGAPAFYELPLTSGIESTTDLINWQSETNLPVTQYLQPMRCKVLIRGPQTYWRAVDRYLK
jgi:hypothetical protein